VTRDPEHDAGTEDEEADPYPLEGKYKDESDRQQYVVHLRNLMSLIFV